MAKVDIGVACAPHQTKNWWSPVMAMLLGEQEYGNAEIGKIHATSSASPDHNKNHVVSSSPWNAEEKRRGDLTDANRGAVAGTFLDGDADYLFFMDDDTVPPKGVISHLIGLGRELVGGVYFNTKPPYNPIAYYRREDGLYSAVYDYVHGSLLPVDSMGMGCTLIHRSVFERIQSGHTLFQRPNGSILVVKNEGVVTVGAREWDMGRGGSLVLTDGERFVFGQDVRRLPNEDDNRAWPFFAMEYGRTEDHHFCELAQSVGIQPYLDTAVTCAHWKYRATGRKEYRKAELQAREVRGD